MNYEIGDHEKAHNQRNLSRLIRATQLEKKNVCQNTRKLSETMLLIALQGVSFYLIVGGVLMSKQL